MNPIKTALTLLVCLLPLSVSAGSVDGKSLVCKNKKDHGVVGFMFIDGTVTADAILETELKYRITRFGESRDDKSYRETGSELSWSTNIASYWVLNRKTLELSRGQRYESSPKKHYVCEVFKSFDDYHDKLGDMRSEKQRQLEEEIQDNKI